MASKHWSQLPDINRHFGACIGGWASAGLSQYRTPEYAYTHTTQLNEMVYAIRGLFSGPKQKLIWASYNKLKQQPTAEFMRGMIMGMGFKPNFAALRRKFPSIPKEPK